MKRIDVKDHYRHELTKLRCWLDGFRTGKGSLMIPGEDILRQIISDIDTAKGLGSPRPSRTSQNKTK